jgi:hypothetical protein
MNKGRTANSLVGCAADTSKHHFVFEGSEDDESELDCKSRVCQHPASSSIRFSLLAFVVLPALGTNVCLHVPKCRVGGKKYH